MKKYTHLALIYALCLTIHAYGQQPATPEHQGSEFQLDFHTIPAPEWTELFRRDSGWIGGDGLFSIPLNSVDTVGAGEHTETLLVFSDSFWGNKVNGKVTSGGQMTNNVVAHLKGMISKADIQFHSGHASDGQRMAVFIPSTPHAESGNYYWLGDGFVNHETENTTYIFAYRMKNTGAEVFGFEECGNALIAIEADDQLPFVRHRQLETPLFVAKSDIQEPYSF